MNGKQINKYLNSKLNKKYCLLLFIVAGNFLYGQNTIFGKVQDSLNNPILFANVIVKTSNTKKIINYTATDEKGHYKLNNLKSGNYLVSYSSLSYETKNITVIIAKESLERNVVLNNTTMKLDEINIKTERAIVKKEDTTIFNVGSFIKGNETVVEDVLNNLPGINVDENGTIKIGNKEIEKVMVEGDDFFKKGYKTLTKNLDAMVIDKVEVYDNYSNNKLLKGIENSEKVAINLILKKDRKLDWFGNVDVNYGLFSANRYKFKSNIMRFGNNVKHYFLTSLNNIGEANGDNSTYYIGANLNNEIGALGDNIEAASIIDLNNFNLFINEERYKFNNEELVSLNSILNIGEKEKLRINSKLNLDKNIYSQNSNETFFLEDGFFKNSESNILDKKINNLDISFNYKYDISKTKLFEIDSKIVSNTYNIDNHLIFNNKSIDEQLKNNTKRIDNKFVYTNKSSNNSVIALTLRQISEKKPQRYFVNNYQYEDLFNNEDIISVNQNSENKLHYYGFEAHYLNKKRKNLLQITSGVTYKKSNLNSNFILNSLENNLIDNFPNYTNNGIFKEVDYYIKLKYLLNFNNITISSSLNSHYLFNKYVEDSAVSKNNIVIINPKFSLIYKINKQNILFLSYGKNISNLKHENIFNNYILSDFRTFNRGVGEINQIKSSNLSIRYQLGSWSDSFTTSVNFSYLKSHDFLSSKSLITPNYSQIDRFIAKNGDFYNADLKIDKFFEFISSNIKIKFKYSKMNYNNILNNGELRNIENNIYQYGFEFKSIFDGVFNYHIGTKWQSSNIKISNSFFFNSNNLLFLDLNLNFNKNLNVSIVGERYTFGNLEKDGVYNFLDLDFKYSLPKKNITFTLSGKNLFDNKTFNQYFISDNSESIDSYKLLPRFVLLGANFRF
ncbi:carboxypeptidase-like regulatory domain-containing protein [Lacinutrix jangbogonensis]|uniref:carboxypeptidase-like regulatory domain-containing protein n=1 Tax=Lacinutrix jangbogonensis TaxID=1469557 RepID=UPI000689B5D5|nr:carboxypeptidase-like regulatory domain-containing protein [Lacinutrix jangbogonensis]